MNKKFELLREAVNTYKVNHCDGNKNEKALLQFIDELEQLTIPDVVGRSEQLSQCKCGNTVQVECDDCKDDRIRNEYM